MTFCQHCFTLQILFYQCMCFDQYLRKSWFLVSKCFCQKITPAPQKTNVVVSICKIVKFSNQTCFVVCTECQTSTKRHNYGHYLCMLLNAGFQNLGKLNTGFDLILSFKQRRIDIKMLFLVMAYKHMSHMIDF